jgi:hypothetical protein
MTKELMAPFDQGDEIDDLLEFTKELEGAVSDAPADNPPVASEEAQAADDSKDKVRTLLAGIGLTGEQIEALKVKYGGLYTFYPSNEDFYVFRPLLKNEWDLLQNTVSDKQTKQVDQQKLEMAVVGRCTIYPKLKDSKAVETRRAGLVPTLFQAIFTASYFISPQMAMNLVVEL